MRPLNEMEREVEQRLDAYVQRKAGCQKTWYQRWLPLLFPTRCAAGVSFYHGFKRNGMKAMNDSVATNFTISVYEQDTTTIICNRDSAELKKDARYFARQLRPLLLPIGEYDGVMIDFSSCVSEHPGGCSSACERSIWLSVLDTATWATAPLRTTNSRYRSRPVTNWEEQE